MELIVLCQNSSLAANLCFNSKCNLFVNASTTVTESSAPIMWILFIDLLRQLFFVLVRPLLVPLVLGIACTWLWNVYIRGLRDYRSDRPLPPGWLGLPLIGETLNLLLWEKSSFFVSRRANFGQIYMTHILGNPTVRVIGYDNIKLILRGENSLVTSQWPTSTCKLLGPGCVSMASGESHVSKKRMIMKAFTCHALNGYAPVIQTITQQYIKEWTSKTNIQGYEELKIMIFEISCRIFFGFQMDRQECEKLLRAFTRFTSNVFSIPLDLPGFGFRKGLCAKQELVRKIKNAIRDHKASPNGSNLSALSLILNSASCDVIDDEEIENICLEFLFASQASTASAACFLISKLSSNQNVRLRTQGEITALGVQKNDVISFQTLNKMTYVNNVVKEVLRMAPPIGGCFRKALKTIELKGYQIPKGWTIVCGIRDTHETCSDVKNTGDFDPDRWSNIQQDGRSSYLPFGGGRRACAGKDFARLILKVVAIELTRGCRVSLVEENEKYSTFPIVEPMHGLPLIVSPA